LTLCSLFITFDYMKFIMDSDCLIKLTKAHLKELACSSFEIILPEQVKREVVDAGGDHPDAEVVRENINRNILSVLPGPGKSRAKGEEEALVLYRRGGFTGICSDDRRFIRRLRVLDVPYVTPAVLMLLLVKNGRLSVSEAYAKLDALNPFISADEYLVAKLKLQSISVGGKGDEDQIIKTT